MASNPKQAKFNGHSSRYRRKLHPKAGKKTVQFNHMPGHFRLAEAAWDPTKAPDSVLVVAIPEDNTMHWITWHYTLTYRYNFPNSQITGHVHCTRNAQGGVDFGPGYYWVHGVEGCDAQTPPALVNRFAGMSQEDLDLSVAEAKANFAQEEEEKI